MNSARSEFHRLPLAELHNRRMARQKSLRDIQNERLRIETQREDLERSTRVTSQSMASMAKVINNYDRSASTKDWRPGIRLPREPLSGSFYTSLILRGSPP